MCEDFTRARCHVTCDQAFFFFFFFFPRANEARGERHKGIIGRGHDLRLVATLHTSLHTRHRCENEANIREIGRAQQAWERSAVVCAVKWSECGANW